MASVLSLGLHTPSAVPYLRAESIIPPESSKEQYRWVTDEDGRQASEEDELLITDYCVVWSQGEIIKRVFRFEVEKEKVLHAVLTWFPTPNHTITKSPPRAGQNSSSNVSDSAQNPHRQDGIGDNAAHSERVKARALVVFLRTQAHVYFLSGTSHVVHLPFEVESVRAAPRGLILQRKQASPSKGQTEPAQPSVPQNSFVSFMTQPWSTPSSQPLPLIGGSSQLLQPPLTRQGTRRSSNIIRETEKDLPRLFTLTDPLTEMGLVVTNPAQDIGSASSNRRTSALPSGVVSPAEEMVFISRPVNDSMFATKNAPDSGAVIALTANYETGMYTIWTVSYPDLESPKRKTRPHRPTASGVQSRPRSSFGPGTGAATPVGHGAGARESSGGALTQSKIASSSLNNTSTGHGETQLRADDELASSLDPDFETNRAPDRKSRRVSSLLARADLSTNRDKAAFSELATGHTSASTAAHLGSFRRGESLGSYSSRGSFGSMTGAGRRSMPVNGSFTTSHDGGNPDVVVDGLLQELTAGGDFDGFQNMGLHEATEGLKREVMMTKVESLPMVTDSAGKNIPHAVPRVFVIPTSNTGANAGSAIPVVMCIANKQDRKLFILDLYIYKRPASSAHARSSALRKSLRQTVHTVRLVQTKTGSGVLDAAKLTHGKEARILVLTETADGHGELTLHSPEGHMIRVGLPERLVIFNPYRKDYQSVLAKSREGSMKRVLRSRPQALKAIERTTANGKVDVIDSEGKSHRIQIQLQPRDRLVAKLLDVCAWVLPGDERGGEGVFTGWIDVQRWLQGQPEMPDNTEWMALIVTLMCMAVDFIPPASARGSTRRKKRSSGVLRSNSGANVDMSMWNEMLDTEALQRLHSADWTAGSGWSWVSEQSTSRLDRDDRNPFNPTRSADTSALKAPATNVGKKYSLLIDCVGKARDFLRTPAGKAASGPEGYLPTAESKGDDFRRTALATVLVGLHLFREDLKLNIASTETSAAGTSKLTPVLAQLGGWMRWDAWGWRDGAYYKDEDIKMEDWMFDAGTIQNLEIPTQLFSPPSIYDWVWKCAKQQNGMETFPTLLTIAPAQGGTAESVSNAGGLRQEHWTTLTPRTPVIIGVFESLAKRQDSPKDIIGKLTKAKIDSKLLETLPEGILIPLREAIVNAQADPPTTWARESLDLTGRDDLSILLCPERKKKDFPRSLLAPTHEALRDVHNICNSTFDTEAVGSFDASAEFDRQIVTKLIFREDRRFIEASRLLQSTKPSVARCMPEPDWSESDLLDAQKELVQTVAIRTLAIPSGRGLLYFSARLPLLTERFPIPGFNLSCLMKPSNNTVSADRSAFTEEKVGWAFFHAGVAAGLSISRDAKGIDTSWIVYNKPTDLSNRHAGFLLALGLNGHLKSIAKWVAFKYLTPKHTMTSIGLLLGLSASYLGTMDTLITRLLSVHVTRMLPPGAAELNLSPLTQTTGMMGIGLLYCNTQHRRMSEVMLSEIEHIDVSDTSTPIDALRDEGYRLAAGFALGYINLGKGKDLRGLHDMHIVERLLGLAVGNKKANIVHVLDKTTAAATVAIALIFMKSHDEALARKIDIPDTMLQFDNVRPDIFLLRTVAKHLIMWYKIMPSTSWIRENLPLDLQGDITMKDIRALRSEHLPFFNIITGLCLSIALRFAGSGSLEVRNILLHYLDQFMRICRLSAINYDQKLTRSTVRNCQDTLALSTATVMAGSGDLQVFRRLRSLHGRTNSETPYGSHLVGHMAIGILFLGGGNYTFGTSDLATASLLCAFYPLTPNTILDNKSHLQAFRHFWVLAAEARCIVARDVETHRPISIPLSISLRSGKELRQTAPCLLPELHEISTVATANPEHWRVVLDFARNASHRDTFARNQTIYVRSRAAHDVTSSSSIFQATLQALNDTETLQHPLEWLLNLPSFATLDKSERALVLPPDAGNPVQASTESTLVDTRLVLEKACLSWDKADRLRNLKLLFAWAERAEAEGRKLKWVTAEVVDRLRAAVWMAFKDEES